MRCLCCCATILSARDRMLREWQNIFVPPAVHGMDGGNIMLSTCSSVCACVVRMCPAEALSDRPAVHQVSGGLPGQEWAVFNVLLGKLSRIVGSGFLVTRRLSWQWRQICDNRYFVGEGGVFSYNDVMSVIICTTAVNNNCWVAEFHTACRKLTDWCPLPPICLL